MYTGEARGGTSSTDLPSDRGPTRCRSRGIGSGPLLGLQRLRQRHSFAHHGGSPRGDQPPMRSFGGTLVRTIGPFTISAPDAARPRSASKPRPSAELCMGCGAGSQSSVVPASNALSHPSWTSTSLWITSDGSRVSGQECRYAECRTTSSPPTDRRTLHPRRGRGCRPKTVALMESRQHRRGQPWRLSAFRLGFRAVGGCKIAVSCNSRGAWISHVTAARIHGTFLPPWLSDSNELHLSKPRQLPSVRRKGVIGHTVVASADEIEYVQGIWMSTRSRTWLDLARRLPLPDLVCMGDQLIRTPRPEFEERETAFTTLEALRDLVGRHKNLQGVVRAREALDLMRVGADSAPESLLRLAMLDAGIPNRNCRCSSDRMIRSPRPRTWLSCSASGPPVRRRSSPRAGTNIQRSAARQSIRSSRLDGPQIWQE